MSKLILIVDDSMSLRSLVKLALVGRGYEVVEADDGLTALAKLESTAKFNLIISDVNMPKLDGIGFLTKVKQHPRHKFTPVMMLTTEGLEARKQQARAAGASAWLMKPFNPTQLLDAVARLIRA